MPAQLVDDITPMPLMELGEGCSAAKLLKLWSGVIAREEGTC